MLKKTITMCIMQAVLSAPLVMAAPAMQLPDDIPPEVRAQFEEAMQKQQAQLGQGTEQQDSDKAVAGKSCNLPRHREEPLHDCGKGCRP